ncbi:MAG: hypothetical protein QGH13_00560, partial [Candidatus Thalassarchaeaceae archaeon]|nr:hypothetical protein [Candidatus Thalassarchaeaceae archaeon]
ASWNPKEPPGDDATDRVRTAWNVDRAKIILSQTDSNLTSENIAIDSDSYISFRHLSMVAQIRANDQDVWASLHASGLLNGEPNRTLTDRLNRMRNWISSEHFPDEYRIEIQTELTDEAKNSFNEGDLKYLIALRDAFNECEWKSDEINNHICNLARDNGMDLRNSFVILYNIHLGRPHGPRLASVLAEIPRDTVIDALTNAIKSLD